MFLSMPPSRALPRTAELGAPGRNSAVGWNWMNSRSMSSAPARQAMAMPSPVATADWCPLEESAGAAGGEQHGSGMDEEDLLLFPLDDHAPVHFPCSMMRSFVKAKSILVARASTGPCR